MSKFTEYIGSQFGNPRGFVGKVCCLIMNVINRAMYTKTVSMIDVNACHKVLDIGYGNGYLLKRLDKNKNMQLYGIDISQDMLQAATKRNANAAKAGRLHLEVGDCCDLQYPENSFDAVTSINTVYFWSDTVKGLQEIRRVLAPGASLYNVVYTKEWLDKLSYTKKGFKKFEPDDLVALGKKAGFERIEIKTVMKSKSFMVIYQK